MPTYDYQCAACGHEFELFQQMSDAVKRKCPKCGKSSLQRLIGTGAGVIFKGGGFYETDYRSESYKKGEEAAKKASEPASDKSEAKEKKAESVVPEKSDAAAAKPDSKPGAETPKKSASKKSVSSKPPRKRK